MAILAQALTDASKSEHECSQSVVYTCANPLMSIDGGADPVLNPRLAQAIANAKKGGFSKASIEGAVARGQGRSATGAALENMTIEAVVPPAALIIDCQTDSKARVLQDVRVLLKKYGARESPSAYLFEKRGRTIFAAKAGVGVDEVLETALELGAIDVVEDEGRIVVDTELESTKAAEKSIVEDLKLEIDSSETIWHPNADTQIEELEDSVYSSLVKLQEELEDYDDVKAVFTNLALPSSETVPHTVEG